MVGVDTPDGGDGGAGLAAGGGGGQQQIDRLAGEYWFAAVYPHRHPKPDLNLIYLK